MERFTTFCLVFLLPFCNGKVCDDSYECSGDEITDAALCDGFSGCSKAIIDGPYAECNGYYGCYLAEKIKASIYVHCDGGYSCYNAKKIRAALYIQCQGQYSCAFTNMQSLTNTNCTGESSCRSSTISSSHHVVCEGKQSCAYSDVSASWNVYCYGRYSCQNTAISAKNYVYVYGHYGAAYASISAQMVYGYGADSLHSADLDSADQEVMDVYLWGYQSGLGAHFVCRAGSVCNVHCSGNGCYQMNLLCLFGAICNVEPLDCVSDGIVNGVNCPIQMMSLSESEDSEILQSMEPEVEQKRKDRKRLALMQPHLKDMRMEDKVDNMYGIFLIIAISFGMVLGVFAVTYHWNVRYTKIYKNDEYKLLQQC